MRFRPRLSVLASAVGLALTQFMTSAAWADSAVGVDTAMGNALNPGRPTLPRDPDPDAAMGKRTPSGQLYDIPAGITEDAAQTAGGWRYQGSADVGVLGGDAGSRNAQFRQYKDLHSGLYVNNFGVEAEKPDSGNFLEISGGGVGRADQFYTLQTGRYNDWKLRAFYTETLHSFTDNYHSLYQGVGGNQLRLPNAPGIAASAGALAITDNVKRTQGVTPNYVGATSTCTPAAPCFSYNGLIYSNATALLAINGFTGTANPTTGAIVAGSAPGGVAGAINTYLAGVSPSELSLVRKKAGSRVDLNLSDRWKVYAGYTLEKRQGARPFGYMDGNNSPAIEVAEPIDYDTHDFQGGLQYANQLTQFNLRMSASLFRNNYSTLNIQNPFLLGATSQAANITQSQFALSPDNEAYSVKAELARSFPDFYKARLTGSVALSSSRQDQSLLMPMTAAAGPTTLNNSGYATGSFNANNWNGVNGLPLSRASADTRIDTRLTDLTLALSPTDALSVSGKLRYYETHNPSEYVAYNPLTGQYGRVILDGASTNLVVSGAKIGGACLSPGGDSVAGCTFYGLSQGLPGISTNAPNNAPVFSFGREQKQLNAVLSADYSINRFASVNAALEREQVDRTERERDRTWDDKLKLGYVNRGFESATLRLSYETARRRGSEYNYWPVAAEYGTGLPGMTYETILANNTLQTTINGVKYFVYQPAANNFAGYLARYAMGTRKTDLADRDQNVFNARLNLLPRDDLDVGVVLQTKTVNYPNSEYGVQTDHQDSATLDINYQPSTEQQYYGFVSYQQGRRRLVGNNGAGTCTLGTTQVNGVTLTAGNVMQLCAQTSTAPLTGTAAGKFLSTDIWHMDTQDQNTAVGFGVRHDFGRFKLIADYSYSQSRTQIGYDFGSTALSRVPATQALMAALAGTGYPDLTLIQNTFSLNLLFPLSRKLSVHVFDRYELGKIGDWHYEGQPIGKTSAVDGGMLMLDAGPRDYRLNVIGVLLQYRF
jgi:hypothetical protein